jgi:hypothetical protein
MEENKEERKAQEEWKQVPGFDHYEISNLGRVRKTSYLRSYGHSGGYPQVQLFNGDGHGKRNMDSDTPRGKCKKVFIHRLIAEAFIPNPDNLPMVNHKDGNKANHDINNLEWCTSQHRCQHAYDLGLNKGGSSQHNRSVIQFDDNGDKVKIWKGVRELRESGFTWNKVYDSIKRGVFYRKCKWEYTNYYYDYNVDQYFIRMPNKDKVFTTIEQIEQDYLTQPIK